MRREDAKEILKHMESVCSSHFFETSRRCQQFLRYIVVETVEGRGDSIKERTIAHEVFGKGTDFEPGEDSLVRVKARELRKRLSEFYEAAPSPAIQIDIPSGSYIPRFRKHSNSQDSTSQGAHNALRIPHLVARRKLLWMLGSSLGVLCGIAARSLLAHHDAPLDRLWKPVFATKTPLIIFLPILKDRASGEASDRIGIGPAQALRQAADFLDTHKYPYHLRFGTDLTFAQLREQPSLLFGGFSSIWTHLMINNLRFSLSWDNDFTRRAVVDNQTKRTWRPSNPTNEGYAVEDYGILCRLFDKDTRQIAMIAAGITTFGTEGAASVFFNPYSLGDLIKQAPPGWESKNFQAVVRVSIVGTTPSFPQIVASYFW